MQAEADLRQRICLRLYTGANRSAQPRAVNGKCAGLNALMLVYFKKTEKKKRKGETKGMRESKARGCSSRERIYRRVNVNDDMPILKLRNNRA